MRRWATQREDTYARVEEKSEGKGNWEERNGVEKWILDFWRISSFYFCLLSG